MTKEVRVRYAPSPTGFYISVERVQHYSIIYMQNIITVNSLYVLKIRILNVM